MRLCLISVDDINLFGDNAQHKDGDISYKLTALHCHNLYTEERVYLIHEFQLDDQGHKKPFYSADIPHS
jgi:hypothetical protein